MLNNVSARGSRPRTSEHVGAIICIHIPRLSSSDRVLRKYRTRASCNNIPIARFSQLINIFREKSWIRAHRK